MFKNYIITTIRTLTKNKTNTVINVMGLALGLCCCLTVFLIIKVELSFDRFHDKVDRTYRLVYHESTSNGIRYNTGTHFPATSAIRSELSGIEQVVATKNEQDVLVTVLDDHADIGRTKFREFHGVGFAESGFFKMFNFEVLRGNPENFLDQPRTAVISEATSKKYFGNNEPVGRSIRVGNKFDIIITGVFKDFPTNTDFPFNKLIISWPTYQEYNDIINVNSWETVMGSAQTYVVLPAIHVPGEIEESLKGFAKKYVKNAEDTNFTYRLQPIGEVHFDPLYGNYLLESVSYNSLYSLGAIGLLILLTAIINFINLSTAHAVKRTGEVGIRKILGSSRKQLILQNLIETFTITFIAIVVGLGLTELLLITLNDYIEFAGTPTLEFTIDIVAFIALMSVVTALLSGLYPSLVISRYEPIVALKPQFQTRSGGMTLRKGLVVFQFVVAQILIIGTIVIGSQITYFKTKDLGINKSAIVEFSIPGNDSTELSLFKNKLLANSDIQSATFSLSNTITNSDTKCEFQYDKLGSDVMQAELKLGDEDFIKTYDIKVIAGRPNTKSDQLNKIVVNEAFLKIINIQNPTEAIGEKINYLGLESTIIGVVKNFHMRSLKDKIDPCIISSYSKWYFSGGAKINLNNVDDAISHLESSWSNIYPNHLFEYQFLDDKISKLYEDESQISRLFGIFSVIAIFISCIGLYGLVTFMTSQKTKEVGIRKVLGASVYNIVALFSKEYLVLGLVAMLISSPLAYYFMNQWLDNFAFRIDINPLIFVIVSIITLLFAGITVGHKSAMAASTNPTQCLRNE